MLSDKIMTRELSARDKEVLLKLVPEMADLLAQGIDIEYMNILPPVANHHSRDEKDFEERLKHLDAQEMRYLADRILDGSESLGCLYPEFAEAFFTAAGQRLSSAVSDRLREAYMSSEGCN
jgi:hypothetical protein